MKNHESRQNHSSLHVNIFKKVGTSIQTWGAFEPGPAVHHTGGDIWWQNSLSLTNVYRYTQKVHSISFVINLCKNTVTSHSRAAVCLSYKLM